MLIVSFPITAQKIQELSWANILLREMEERNLEPLTEELLGHLVRNVISSAIYRAVSEESPNALIGEWLFDKPYSSACGCMGPQDGNPFCGCTMSFLRYEYRYEIALELINNLEKYDQYLRPLFTQALEEQLNHISDTDQLQAIFDKIKE